MRSRLLGNITRTLLAGLLLLSLVGCATLSKKDLAGTWVHEEPGRATTVVTIHSDGTFEWKDVPLSVFRPSGNPKSTVDWAALIDAHGKWSIVRDGNIHFQVVPDDSSTAFGSIAYTDGLGSNLILFQYVGHNDDNVRFVLAKKP